MRRIASALLLLLPLAAAGCDSPTEPTVENTRYAAHLGVDLAASTRLPSGVYIRDVETGSGTLVQNGTRVAVHYKGWLTNGTLFDQRQAPDAPFVFTVGTSNVIAGWHQGVAGMRVGGRRQLIIPPAQGYGSQTFGPIPGGSILVFEVSALSVQ